MVLHQGHRISDYGQFSLFSLEKNIIIFVFCIFYVLISKMLPTVRHMLHTVYIILQLFHSTNLCNL